MALVGLLSTIGAIAAIANSASARMIFDDAFNATISMAIFTRVAVIIDFVAAIALIAIVFRTPGFKKGAAITGGVFATMAFIGQFLINPLTNAEGLTEILTDARPIGGAITGLLIIPVAGIATLICGIISLVAKSSTVTQR